MARPPNADAGATRRKILEAACDLLVEEGTAALTSRAVARRADVSPALVNHHFIDRAGLVDVVIETVYEGVHGIGRELLDEAASGADLVAVTESAVRRMFRHAHENRPFIRLFLTNVVATGELDAARAEQTQGPFLAAAAAFLARHSPHGEMELRLRLRSMVMLISRYAALSDDEIRAQVGTGAGDPLAAVEEHLVGLGRQLFFAS